MIVEEAGTGESEDASILQLGPDFSGKRCLLNSEVEFLLQNKRDNKTADQINDTELSSVFISTLNYATQFSRYKNRQAITQVRGIKTRRNLEEFEITALGNLCPETAEEAKALIPTLKKLTDDDLAATLNDLANLRNFT